MSAIKNIFFSVSTNIWILVVSIGLNFITPYFISVEDFGYMRSFMLYVSFTGIMHLGFIDGVYLHYAGIPLSAVNRREFNKLRAFFFIFQLCCCLLFFILGYVLGNSIMYYCAVAALMINTFNFGNYFFQSTNQFKIFSKVNIIVNLFLVVAILLLFYVFKVRDYHWVIYAVISSYALGALIYEYLYRRKLGNGTARATNPQLRQMIFSLFKLGFFILVGNLMLLYLLMADRWIVNLLFEKTTFAYYAFAGSILTIVISLITSVSMALYPLLVKKYETENVNFLKVVTLITATIGMTTYFFGCIIINLIFVKYLQSVVILKYMVMALPAISVISVLSVNYYKINKLGKEYVSDLFIIAIISTAINLTVYHLHKSTTAIVIVSLFCLNFSLWFINRRNKLLRFGVKEVLYYVINILMFQAVIYFIHNVYLAGASFVAGSVLVSLLFFRKELKSLLVKLKKK